MPPLLLGAALAFWGWHTGLWWLGLPLALLAELPHRLDWHWELSLKDRHRVADLCGVLMVLAGVYLYLTQPRLGLAVILLIQWLPVVLFPLLAAQLYGDRPGLELSTLFVSLRGRPQGERLWDPRPAYLLLCLIAAAMVPPGQGRLYLPAAAVLAAWTLWAWQRPRRIRPWVISLALAVGLGQGIALGLQEAQRDLEDILVSWLAGWLGDRTDPYHATTAIGEVGRLKQAEHIALRVHTDRPLSEPLLLRTASYNRYLAGNWLARHLAFEPLVHERSGWRLGPNGAAPRRVQIELGLDEGHGILPLPGNARSVRGLAGASLSRNPYGTVKVLEGPASARYGATYRGTIADLEPQSDDLLVPKGEEPVIAGIVDDLGLAGLAPDQALLRLHGWFLRGFSYSLELEANPGERTALGHFLIDRRAGHCEYFASAAVLLLRQAGIPARYVRGWSVQEFSGLEDAYVARDRHAHAWVQTWVDGAWRDFDPTPPDWAALEEDARPWWGPVHDLLSRAAYLIARWQESGEGNTPLIWLLPPLVALLIWRIARRGRRASRRGLDRAPQQSAVTSPFAPLEAALARRGHGRHRGETLREWARRLETEPIGGPLSQAVALYYRKRFDPLGLDARDESRLTRILDEISRRPGMR